MRFHSRIIGSRDLSFCQKKVSLVKIDEEFWAVRECGSVGLWLLWFSANLRGIKDPVPPAVQVSTSWETVWDHKTYSEVKTVQRHQNLVTIEDSSPLKTVQRQGKLLTATWLVIPECQVPPTGRGLLGSNRILEFCRVQLTIRAGFVASLWALGVWLFCYTMFKGNWKYLKRISVFENTVNRVFFLCDRRVFIIHWGMQRKKDISIYFLPVACSLAPGYHVSLQREGGILCGGCSWLLDLEKDKYNQNPEYAFCLSWEM